MKLVSKQSKLPKQWCYWCRKAGLNVGYRLSDQRKKYSWWYLKGHGHRWRVNSENNFQISYPEIHFDRWANSFKAEVRLPQTEKEFLDAVKQLIDPNFNQILSDNESRVYVELVRQFLEPLQDVTPTEFTEWKINEHQ